jgi:inosose dehydratase
VLSAIADAGYEGTELGPPGYLGQRDNLRDRLEEYGLALVGGYIPIRFSEPEHWAEDLAAMSGTLELFAAAEGTEAKAVLAELANGAPAARLTQDAAAAVTRMGSSDHLVFATLRLCVSCC